MRQAAGLLIFFSLSLIGCATVGDVLKSKDDGVTKEYQVSTEQAWEAAKSVLRDAGASSIDEKREQNCLVGETGSIGFSSGVYIGAWIESAGDNKTRLTFSVIRKISTQAAKPVTEEDLHSRFSSAVSSVASSGKSGSGEFGMIPMKKYGMVPLEREKHEPSTNSNSNNNSVAQDKPIIVIGTPEDGQKTSSTTVRIKGVCSSRTEIEIIECYLNDTKIGQSRGIGGTRKSLTEGAAQNQDSLEYSFEFDAGLSDGANKIQINAKSKDGQTATKSVSVTRSALASASEPLPSNTKLPAIKALVAGISSYKDPSLNLRYASKDAELVVELLKSSFVGVKESNVRFLLDEKATRENMIGELGDFLKRAGEDDLLILYFAMHGVGDPEGGDDFYFLCHDSKLQNLEATAFSRGSLEKLIRKSDANRIIVISDACHAGVLGTSGMGKRDPAAVNYALLKRISEIEGKGVTFFSASDANEYSQETEDLGHGVFTHFFVKGLKGEADENKDGFVSLQEIEEYTYLKVKEKTKGAQRPRMVRPISKDLPLSKVR
ncbi:MAG: caspase family protein [Planctomycetes bacterium]|nr:caspase family protein [Planctomycetota bacterium]